MGAIVVGVDGSEGSQRALAWAAAEAKRRGSTLRVLHSWTFPSIGTREQGQLPHADIEAAARELVDEAAASLGSDPGIEVETVVADDLPARALIDASVGADMLVVGSRGRGGFSGLLLGSVSQQVANHARCPVVIVPAGR